MNHGCGQKREKEKGFTWTSFMNFGLIYKVYAWFWQTGEIAVLRKYIPLCQVLTKSFSSL